MKSKILMVLFASIALNLGSLRADDTLSEKSTKTLEKFKDFRRQNLINFSSDKVKDEYRDAEDELADIASEIRKLEAQLSSETADKFELMDLYRSILAELVVDKTISGPVLASSTVEFNFGGAAEAILKKVSEELGFNIGVGGNVKIRSQDIRSVYQKARSKVLAKMSECVVAVGGFKAGLEHPQVLGLVTYLRSYRIISQPECVGMFNRIPEAFQAC